MESALLVQEHINSCSECKSIYDSMISPSDIRMTVSPATLLGRIADWKASVLQSMLLFLSFFIIITGVTLEAATPLGTANGFWTFTLLIPATGFMLSLANWYFVRLYKNRKLFSTCSLLVTFIAIFCGYLWGIFHYEVGILTFTDTIQFVIHYDFGLILTIVFCILSKLLSNQYGKMLGKE